MSPLLKDGARGVLFLCHPFMCLSGMWFPRYLSMICINWWIFTKLLSAVHCGPEINFSGVGVKRSKVMVIGQRCTELDAVCGVLTRLGRSPKVPLRIVLAELLQAGCPSCCPADRVLWGMTVYLTRDSMLPPYCRDMSDTVMVAWAALPYGFKGKEHSPVTVTPRLLSWWARNSATLLWQYFLYRPFLSPSQQCQNTVAQRFCCVLRNSFTVFF